MIGNKKRIQKLLTKKFLIKEYNHNNKSTYRIAKIIGCNHTTIINYLKKYNIKRRNPQHLRLSHVLTKSFLYKEYIKNKKSVYEISKEFNYSKQNIYNYLKIYRIKVRTASEVTRGKNNPMFGVHRFGKEAANYIDGRTEDLYPSEFNNKLKYRIRERDNFTCQNCGMTEEEHIVVYGRVLEIHHIDYNRGNCNENNLITTCRQCNARANANRDYWFSYFMYKTEQEINL